MTAYGKLVINVCVTGNVPTKRNNPNLATTPKEIAADVKACLDLGASVFHIHARDADGKPTWKPDVNAAILSAVRAKCPDAILCATTSGRVFKDLEERAAVLDLEGDAKPDLASLTMGSMNFAKEASVNDPATIRALAERMRARGIVPELEIFDVGMMDFAAHLIERGALRPPLLYNLFLGNLGTASATPQRLAAMLGSLPKEAHWAGAGIGRFQFPVNCMAIAMGGHVRVGLEDNLWMDVEKTTLASNPKLVERLVAVGRSMGREPATPDEARALMGLPPHRPTVRP